MSSNCMVRTRTLSMSQTSDTFNTIGMSTAWVTMDDSTDGLEFSSD